MIITSAGLQVPNLEPTAFYFLYLGQIIVIGSLVQIILIYQDKRVDDIYVSLSLEINFCIGLLVNSMSPALVGFPEPVPSICIACFCLVGIFSINLLGAPKKNRNVAV